MKDISWSCSHFVAQPSVPADDSNIAVQWILLTRHYSYYCETIDARNASGETRRDKALWLRGSLAQSRLRWPWHAQFILLAKTRHCVVHLQAFHPIFLRLLDHYQYLRLASNPTTLVPFSWVLQCSSCHIDRFVWIAVRVLLVLHE